MRLARYLELARAGEEVVVTDRGSPIARLTPVDGSTDQLRQLIDDGVVIPARRAARSVPRRVSAAGTVSDLVAQPRR